ncbi:hypothetical protein SLEP1_g25206 [Rubroshorea leprosula]|uniref:Integrase catalytic domain-containing protein n=1 Tax=Rubroshorea leprosula TaxID=152421 RepID=A0AAV5JPD0_9ROSI|nr:hypothetical protein SLEP1_g25206 [Rubroshorea leprosula]
MEEQYRKSWREGDSTEAKKNQKERAVTGLPSTHTDYPEHVFQLSDCIFQISTIVSRFFRFPRFFRLVHSLSLEASRAMPPRKSRDKEVQPAQADHADDSPLHSEGENDPITFLPVSPLAERSYGNLVFKEKEADRGGDFAESSNVFRGMTERLDLAFKEQNQAMWRLVDSQAESSRREEELIRQCIEEMRRVFEKGTRVMQETGEKSRRTLQAVSEQVVEQVRQPRLEILAPVVEMPRQIQEAPIPALGGQGNQPHPNIQQQNFFMGEGQRQHEPMEAAAPVADHGHQPQHKYILPTRKGNVGPHAQSHPRDFFQPQVPPAQPVQRGLQNQPVQFFNKDHGPALRPLEKIDKDILKFPDKAKETMGGDADPFPAVFVGVNVADLRSVARNRSLPYAQRNLAAEDLRWVLEAQRSRHSRSVRSPRMVKPPLRSPSKRWEKISHLKFPAQNTRTVRRRLQRKKAEEWKRQQQQMEIEGSSSRRPRQPIKRNMVWVRKEKKEAVTQILLKGYDQSPASPKVASFIVNPDGKEEEPIVCEFPEQTEEEVIVVPAQDDEEEDMADKIVFEKPEEKMDRHIRPLYINAHMDGTPISRVLVDNGAAVNVLPTCMPYKIGKSLDDLVHTEVTISDFTGGVNHSRGVLPVELTVGNRTLMSAFVVVDTVATYNALLGRDWIHSSWCVPSSLHQKLIFWNGGKAEMDWRFPIIQYLKDQSIKVSRKTKMQALNYVLIEDVLYRRGNDELLLRCLGPDESFQMLSDVHDGICGAHQARIKMRWLIRRHGFFWSSVLKDCIAYAKGYKSCQIHGPLQRVPASELNSIVKPWPFRGWAIDLIGKVYPPSSKGHSFIIVATDYFTKWVEAKPVKKVDQSNVIKFIKEDIIHRFGLPETITTNQGTVFVSHQVEAFAKEMFRLLNSTPHYAQANGQAEASNKVVINLLEKMVDDNPRRWHELLSETLWAYRTSQRSSTKMTPFALTYGHDAVLPMELTARSLRVMIQNNLQFGEYDEAMMLELEDLEDSRLTALDRLQAQKLKVAKSYNKRVKGKNLVVGDLVWKAILPFGKKDHRFGKWSPNWEGPFRIHEVLRGGAYWLESLDGELHPRKINGIYLKPYYPTVWEARGLESQEAV